MKKEQNNKVILYNTEDGKIEGELSKKSTIQAKSGNSGSGLFKPDPTLILG